MNTNKVKFFQERFLRPHKMNYAEYGYKDIGAPGTN